MFKYKIFSLVLFFMLMLVSPGLTETYHIDPTLGNDSNSGLSMLLPWKTIKRVNAQAANSQDGDRFLFKRGEVWTGSQQSLGHTGSGYVNWRGVDNLVFGDYGSLNKPRPWFNGNDFGPIRLNGNGTSSGWMIKNFDLSGMDGWGSINQGAMKLKNLVDLTISGMYADGHRGATKFAFHIQMIDLVNLTGDFLMQDCEFRNMYKLGDFNGWDYIGQDAHVMFIDSQTWGTMRFLNNIFSGAYADLIQYWHVDTILWQGNLFEKFGENSIDQKSVTNPSYIENTFKRGWTEYKGSGNKEAIIVHIHRSNPIISTNAIIKRNIFIGGHDDRGVGIQSASKDTVIEGNQFSGFDIAINLYHANGVRVESNEICDSATAIKVGSRSTGVEQINNTVLKDCGDPPPVVLTAPTGLRIIE